MMENKNGPCHSQEKASGVNCDVTTCTYHAPGHVCTAGEIKVGPSDAFKMTDTVCATFEKK